MFEMITVQNQEISWTYERDIFRDIGLQTGKIMPKKFKEKRVGDEDRKRKRER